MTTRSRILWFGSAAALVIAGVVSAVLIAGGTGQVLALVLISVGLVLATALGFLEVGLSEDRERARQPPRDPGVTDAAVRRLPPPRSSEHATTAAASGERDVHGMSSSGSLTTTLASWSSRLD